MLDAAASINLNLNKHPEAMYQAEHKNSSAEYQKWLLSLVKEGLGLLTTFDFRLLKSKSRRIFSTFLSQTVVGLRNIFLNYIHSFSLN